jgi:hypothetical protein
MSKRWIGAAMALAAATSLLATAATGLGGRSRTSQLTFKLDHYLCYSIEPAEGTSWSFTPRTFVVRDQFRPPRTTRVVKPDSLCNPVSKDGSKIRNRSAHLLCYVSRYSKTFPARGVAVQNQFGRSRLKVYRPTFLCVPSGKSLDPNAPPRLPRGLDHFQCYPVTGPLIQRKGKVADQFGDDEYFVGKPMRLCNPARKTKLRVSSTSPLINARDHLVCYAVRFDFAGRKGILVRNQLGQLRLNATAPKMLCLPSLKQELR